MERRYEGLGNAVKSIVKTQNDESRRRDYIDGILAEKIVTDVAYAGAVEAALEGLTDVLLVRDMAVLLQDRADPVEPGGARAVPRPGLLGAVRR